MTCGGAWARGGSGKAGLANEHDFAPGLHYQNLAQTLHCLAVLLHLVGGPLLEESVKHAKDIHMSH